MQFFIDDADFVIKEDDKYYFFTKSEMVDIFGSIESAITFYHMRGDMIGYQAGIPVDSSIENLVEIARV